MLVASLALMVLVGCESDEEIAQDMERSLREANVALLGALVSAEVLVHVYEEPDRELRHGYEICGCPCTERIGSAAPYVMTLDYDPAGCVPESGLLSTAMAGHATVDFDGNECNVSWDGLKFALEHDVTGALKGTVVETDRTTIEARGVVEVGDQGISLDLRLVVDARGLTLDGEATVASDDPRPITFRGVELEFDEIAPPCPAPTVGSVTRANLDNEKKDVVISFADPGDGFVKVERDGRVSESADWCAYTSDLW